MPNFEQHVDIHAPVEAVWAVIADPTQWPQWFPDLDGVAGLDALQPGATFQYQHAGNTGQGRVERVQPNHELAVITEMDGHEATHTFTLSPHGGLLGMGGSGATLEYVLHYHAAGGFLGDLVVGGNPADLLKVKNTLNKVKELVEVQTGRH